ncbi:CRP/FNR family transcriptional regulator, anaerobic regulatory protein [Cnuella takakiae]|uniref:CRP/FNR family transcriptional regulator, anaerobic regulatory protein n=1 Tax=Cnuella takakiae TaxID=1302690 RepID=A0A1M4YFY6_9BACT|nr:Crp/Fnr family transcriptional regulator [Cnuella takakiae]OLY93138.1 transcriptional regulator [Cnuella takakiae]SHF04641.1 CRP/FNR family transcriptional regulator, anaerobic regulatory protein [Cnuella takakiae]
MKKLKQGCDLHSCFLCRNVIEAWRPLLELRRQTYSVAKGEQLFTEGAQVEGVFFLVNGKVKVHQRWTEDKELILRFAGPGAIVGHRGLGADLHYPVSATALEPCTICFIPLDFFYATLKTNPELLLLLMQFFADELRESEQRMRNMARLTVKSRVAAALLFLEQKFGTTADGYLNITISRQDLAAYVGATYETVFRMLAELSDAGLIQTSGKELLLSDHAGLQTAAGQE